jgi:hypothetical protein
LIEINLKKNIETPKFLPAYDGVLIVGYNEDGEDSALSDTFVFGDIDYLAKAIQTLLAKNPNLRARLNVSLE